MMLRSICVSAVKIFYKLAFSLKVEGLENLPENGAYVLCGNHKSNFDGPLVMCYCKQSVKALAKAELFSTKIGAWFFDKLGAIPVKRGENDIKAVKKCLEVLKSGNGLLIFPQGKRLKTIDPADFKPGAVAMAKKTNSPLIPFGINGDYKFRKTLKITFGKPIYREEIENSLALAGENADETVFLAEKIKALAEG